MDADDDLAVILASVAGADDAGTQYPSPDLEAYFTPQHIALTEGIGSVDPASLDECLAGGGYGGLAAALAMPPDAVIRLVLDAGLLGRGGAFFPAARKWQRPGESPPTASSGGQRRGRRTGRVQGPHLMEGNPHRIVEGALIAAYAADAANVVIYVNAEANLSAERMYRAVADATTGGLIGDNILGSGFGCTVSVRRGAGGYVCGEETTLLNTIEGRRREPRTEAALPHRRRPLRRTDRDQQRRNPCATCPPSSPVECVGSPRSAWTKPVAPGWCRSAAR